MAWKRNKAVVLMCTTPNGQVEYQIVSPMHEDQKEVIDGLAEAGYTNFIILEDCVSVVYKSSS